MFSLIKFNPRLNAFRDHCEIREQTHMMTIIELG